MVKIIIKFNKLALSAFIAIASLNGCQTFSLNSAQQDSPGIVSSVESQNEVDSGTRSVNQVHWDKTGEQFQIPSVNQLQDNQSQIIFYRPFTQFDQSTDSKNVKDYQDSVNIGINQRFHTSLQPGQFSHVIVCNGEQILSTEITNSKTNYLNNPVFRTSFEPKHTYYFQVDVDQNANMATLTEMDESTAANIIKNVSEQTHQINRVIADSCPDISPQPQPEVTSEPAEPIVVDKPIKLDVLFDFDSARIRGGYQSKLQAVADFMQKYPDVKTELGGHTDNLGNDHYNQQLSQRRVDAVKNELVNKYGIAANRIDARGYGESQPIDTNDTKQGRQNNRRVIAIIHHQTN